MNDKKNTHNYQFSPAFKWGLATSAYQIEGAWNEDGRGESIWDRHCHTPGAIKDGSSGDVACDHYHRFKEDIKLLKDIGVNTYRFSISWPRIFPDGSKKIEQKGVDFYQNLVNELQSNGIIPNATLYHWDLPQKLQEIGGWANREIVKYYEEYAGTMFQALGGGVSLWSTFNEPRLISMGYEGTIFAPALGNMKAARYTNHNILLSHGKAVGEFRRQNIRNSEIGIVIDLWDNWPARNCDADIKIAEDRNEEFYRVYLNPLFKGKYTDYLIRKMEEEGNLPSIYDGDMDIIRSKMDFLGLNIYSRSIVSEDPVLNNIEERKRKNPEKFPALNHEICPEVIYNGPMLIKNQYEANIPIYITENGCPTPDMPSREENIHDSIRQFYLEAYIKELYKAIKDGANIKGYYQWSLMDNFEWAEGYLMRCGSIYVDFKTQERVWKDSTYWYSDVVKNNRIK